jgi:hypothetical protein
MKIGDVTEDLSPRNIVGAQFRDTPMTSAIVPPAIGELCLMRGETQKRDSGARQDGDAGWRRRITFRRSMEYRGGGFDCKGLGLRRPGAHTSRAVDDQAIWTAR